MLVLGSIVSDLTVLAEKKKMEPVFGRERELLELVQVLARNSHDPVLLVGEPGVGRSALVDALAWAIAEDNLEGLLLGYRVFKLDLRALLAESKNVGDDTRSLVKFLRINSPNILFVRDGGIFLDPTCFGREMETVASLLHPLIAERQLKFIGAITPQEYQEIARVRPSIAQEFVVLNVEPMKELVAVEVLRKWKPRYETNHGVVISDNAIQSAVRLTQRYIPYKFLPGKAMELMDRACTRARLARVTRKQVANGSNGNQTPEASDTVTAHDVRRALCLLAPVDPATLDMEEANDWMRGLRERLERRVKGQDRALFQVASFMKELRAQKRTSNVPAGTLLLGGPKGVGKSLLANELAKALLGPESHYWLFDLTQYIDEGAAARLMNSCSIGEMGPANDLVAVAEQRARYKVAIFENVDRAHPGVLEFLCDVLEKGSFRDEYDTVYSFGSCLSIFTTTLDAETEGESEQRMSDAEFRRILTKQLGFAFMARVECMVVLSPFTPNDVQTLIGHAMKKVVRNLRTDKVTIHLCPRAYSFLSKKAAVSERGAHAIEKTLDVEILDPINDMLVKNMFSPGDTIDVDARKGSLTFRPRVHAW